MGRVIAPLFAKSLTYLTWRSRPWAPLLLSWEQCQAAADRHYGHAGGLRKNVLHIAAALSEAWRIGKTGVQSRTFMY